MLCYVFLSCPDGLKHVTLNRPRQCKPSICRSTVVLQNYSSITILQYSPFPGTACSVAGPLLIFDDLAAYMYDLQLQRPDGRIAE